MAFYVIGECGSLKGPENSDLPHQARKFTFQWGYRKLEEERWMFFGRESNTGHLITRSHDP